MGLEEEAVFFLLQRAISDKHQIQSAFTRGSVRGSIYVEGILDVDTISLLNSTPGIIWKQSGVREPQWLPLDVYILPSFYLDLDLIFPFIYFILSINYF